MAKLEVKKETIPEVVKGNSKFLDKTHLQWYSKSGTNKITFCTCLNDIIENKGETFEYSEKLLSSKTIKNEERERNNYYLFVLKDGRFILARIRDELR